VAVLADGGVHGIGSKAELAQSGDAAVKPYFDGPRGARRSREGGAGGGGGNADGNAASPREPASKPR
jgi:hypothetical protein